MVPICRYRCAQAEPRPRRGVGGGLYVPTLRVLQLYLCKYALYIVEYYSMIKGRKQEQ